MISVLSAGCTIQVTKKSTCDDIEDRLTKNRCYQEQALAEQDPTICDKVQEDIFDFAKGYIDPDVVSVDDCKARAVDKIPTKAFDIDSVGDCDDTDGYAWTKAISLKINADVVETFSCRFSEDSTCDQVNSAKQVQFLEKGYRYKAGTLAEMEPYISCKLILE